MAARQAAGRVSERQFVRRARPRALFCSTPLPGEPSSPCPVGGRGSCCSCFCPGEVHDVPNNPKIRLAGMTNASLQSHVDFAKRLMDAARPDDEVVSALCHRGLEAPQASQLVHDLHGGLLSKPELVGARPLSGRQRSPRSPPSRDRIGPSNLGEWAVLLLILSLAGGTAAYIFSHLDQNLDTSRREENPKGWDPKAVYLDSPNLQVSTDHRVQVSTELSTSTNHGTTFTVTNSTWRSTNDRGVDSWNQLFLRQLGAP